MDYVVGVNCKRNRIAAVIEACQGQELDPHYLGYFDCFNRQFYFEAHEVLEDLWLPSRRGPHGDFYKGLIQLAGAFVHLQKDRLQPAASLLRLARSNLAKYPACHQRLNLQVVQTLIANWLAQLEAGGFRVNPFTAENRPRLMLQAP